MDRHRHGHRHRVVYGPIRRERDRRYYRVYYRWRDHDDRLVYDVIDNGRVVVVLHVGDVRVDEIVHLRETDGVYPHG